MTPRDSLLPVNLMYKPGDLVNPNIKGANAPANNNKMSPKTRFMRSPSPVGLGRSSFSSIRERDSDLAQTFTSTKISSYSSHNLKQLVDEVAVSDEPSTPTSPLSAPSTAGDITVPSDNNMLLLPSQHGAVDFDLQSRENDLAQSFARSLAWLNTPIEPQVDASSVDLTDTVMEDVEDVKLTQSKQPFETLPIEIYRKFFSFLRYPHIYLRK